MKQRRRMIRDIALMEKRLLDSNVSVDEYVVTDETPYAEMEEHHAELVRKVNILNTYKNFMLMSSMLLKAYRVNFDITSVDRFIRTYQEDLYKLYTTASRTDYSEWFDAFTRVNECLINHTVLDLQEINCKHPVEIMTNLIIKLISALIDAI
jgi:hypothetical protein